MLIELCLNPNFVSDSIKIVNFSCGASEMTPEKEYTDNLFAKYFVLTNKISGNEMKAPLYAFCIDSPKKLLERGKAKTCKQGVTIIIKINKYTIGDDYWLWLLPDTKRVSINCKYLCFSHGNSK